MQTVNLEAIHEAQLFIMDDIHRICVKYGIKYYLIGGSAIGAIRHKGFIPWDIDIDIAMPREDYERFSVVAQSELLPQLKILNYTDDPMFTSPHILVILKNSVLTFTSDLVNTQFKRYGLFVDILPLDKVPVAKTTKKRQKHCLKYLKTIYSYRVLQYYKTDSTIKKRLKKIIIPIVYKFPTTPVINRLHRVAQWGNKDENYLELCSMLSHYDYDKLCMPKEWFGTPRLMEYSGRFYFAPQCIEKYLTKLFGDYMSFPPENERVEYAHKIHEASFDL